MSLYPVNFLKAAIHHSLDIRITSKRAYYCAYIHGNRVKPDLSVSQFRFLYICIYTTLEKGRARDPILKRKKSSLSEPKALSFYQAKSF